MALGALRTRILAIERSLQIWLQRRFERQWGLETTRKVDLDELGVARENRIFYVAASAPALRVLFRRLRLGSRDVIADVGSGKGQAIIVAATYPVARVIGVELAEDLAATARANVESVRGRLRCQDVELVTGDALEWPIPDDVSVVYLYCPFIGDLFHAFVQRVFDSFDRSPRPLFLVYGFPWEHNWLIQTGRVRTADVNFSNWPRRPGWWDSDHVFVTYRVTAPDGSAPERPVAGGGLGWRKAMEYWSRPNETQFVLYPPGGGPPMRSG